GAPAIDRAEVGCVDAVEGEDLLGQVLVLRQVEPARSGAGEAAAEQLEVTRDVRVVAVVAGERLDQIEQQVGLRARQLDQALARAVDANEDRIVPGLLERFVDGLDIFVGGFLLGALPFDPLLVLVPPVVVENADPQFGHGRSSPSFGRPSLHHGATSLAPARYFWTNLPRVR